MYEYRTFLPHCSLRNDRSVMFLSQLLPRNDNNILATLVPLLSEERCGAVLFILNKLVTKNLWPILYSIFGILSAIGIVINVLNITVLYRMASPINVILMALAISDLITSQILIIYCIYKIFLPDWIPTDSHSYYWVLLIYKWMTNAIIIPSTISMYLTILMAIWKFIAVALPYKAKLWCTLKTTYWAVILIYVSCGIIISLSLITWNSMFEIDAIAVPISTKEYFTKEQILYQMIITSYAREKNLFNSFITMLRSICPVAVLIGLFLSTIIALMLAEKRRQKLFAKRTPDNLGNDRKQVKQNRTSYLLWTTLLLYVFTESPIPIFLAYDILWPFPVNIMLCVENLTIFPNILSYANSIIMFFLNYCMSSRFRTALNAMFSSKKPRKPLPNKAINHVSVKTMHV